MLKFTFENKAKMELFAKANGFVLADGLFYKGSLTIRTNGLSVTLKDKNWSGIQFVLEQEII